jgi:4-carboxymuconolactone decarboxylase
VSDLIVTRADPEAWRTHGLETYRDVMCVDAAPLSSPSNESGLLDFVFADIWNRPGLGRRERRLVALACVCAADTVGPIEDHVYAALKSGDLDLVAMQEFVLHFAVYCGWPKASFVDQVVARQQARVDEEAGATPRALATHDVWCPGLDPEVRLQNGEDCFSTINCVPPVPRWSPYTTAGILNFVFGEVWQRPGLSVRDRRFITLACVGVDDTVGPIQSHVYSALKSTHVSFDEMREFVLQFAAYSGWPKASYLDQVAAESWQRIQQEEADLKSD